MMTNKTCQILRQLLTFIIQVAKKFVPQFIHKKKVFCEKKTYSPFLK